jgi:uncharacterized membrane protein
MAAGWFFFVFRQGRIHLYQGVGKNEYFEPEGGLDYLGWGTLLWIASGALVGLALFFLCGLLNAKSREVDFRNGLDPGKWLWIPPSTLVLHPLLGLAGAVPTLIPVFHSILVLGCIVAIVGSCLSFNVLSRLNRTALCWTALAALVLCHFLVCANLNIRQFRAQNLGYYDSGQIAEGFHHTLNGKFMMTYNQPHKSEPGPGTNLDHIFVTRICVLFPLYCLFPKHETIIVFNALVLSLGAIPAFLIARRLLDSHSCALVFGLAYLLYPPLMFLEFRSGWGPSEEGQLVPLLLAAGYCLTAGRPWLAIVWAVLTMCVKENAAVTITMFGIFMAVFSPHRKHGVGLAAGAALYFIIGTKLILPMIDEHAYKGVMGVFSHLGQGYLGIAWRTITDPIYVLGILLAYSNFSLLLHLLVPLGAAAAISPSRILILAPAFLFLMLSGSPYHHSILYWNHAILIPVVFYAGIHGLNNARAKLNEWWTWTDDSRAALMAAVFACSVLSFSIFFLPMMSAATFEVRPRHRIIRNIQNLIPVESSVFATYRAAGHFTNYGRLEMSWRYLPGEQDYLVFDAMDRWARYERTLEARDVALKDESYGLVMRKGRFLVFKKGAPRDYIWDNILLDGIPAVQFKSGQIQQNGAELIGWNVLPGKSNATVRIESFWRCHQPLNKEYEVVVFFRLPDGSEMSSRHLMAGWIYPTTIWRPGDIVRDTTEIAFSGPVPADFKVAISLEDYSLLFNR